jgi:predicted nucleic acid-binding protein
MIVLDTNVLLEAFRPQPAPGVMQWLAAQEPLSVFTTTVTQAELLYWIEIMASGKRRSKLAAAIDRVLIDEFRDRILPFDEDAARMYPKIVAERRRLGLRISQFDAMIAAVSKSRRATLATRNTGDFEHCGVRIVNPWTE